MATARDVIARLRAEPFSPFVVVLIDGSKVRVDDRDRVAVGDRRLIVVEPRGGRRHFLHVADVALEDLPA